MAKYGPYTTARGFLDLEIVWFWSFGKIELDRLSTQLYRKAWKFKTLQILYSLRYYLESKLYGYIS